jgi:hypothetical protein
MIIGCATSLALVKVLIDTTITIIIDPITELIHSGRHRGRDTHRSLGHGVASEGTLDLTTVELYEAHPTDRERLVYISIAVIIVVVASLCTLLLSLPLPIDTSL